MGYKLETTALISIDNYNAFRIRCIMLILEKLNNHIPSVTILRTLTIHMPEDLTLTSIQPFPYV
ncbi:hypothetical protein F7P82_22900 [Acinetobacter guillouiae]|nr:hypothetical protein F7P82_22900 [Acinetobacter guillouiae]